MINEDHAVKAWMMSIYLWWHWWQWWYIYLHLNVIEWCRSPRGRRYIEGCVWSFLSGILRFEMIKLCGLRSAKLICLKLSQPFLKQEITIGMRLSLTLRWKTNAVALGNSASGWRAFLTFSFLGLRDGTQQVHIYLKVEQYSLSIYAILRKLSRTWYWCGVMA